MWDAKQKARRLGVLGALAAGLLATAGCANDRGPHPDLPRLGVYTTFTSRNMCGLGVSPQIRVISSPAGAASYRIKMTNVSALSGPSEEYTIPGSVLVASQSSGLEIPEGVIADFTAPCVPEGPVTQIFTYRVEVMALASTRQPLAYGWTFAGVFPLTRRLGIERGTLLQQQRARAAETSRAAGITPRDDAGPQGASALPPGSPNAPTSQFGLYRLPSSPTAAPTGPTIGAYQPYPPEISSYFFIH